MNIGNGDRFFRRCAQKVETHSSAGLENKSESSINIHGKLLTSVAPVVKKSFF